MVASFSRLSPAHDDLVVPRPLAGTRHQGLEMAIEYTEAVAVTTHRTRCILTEDIAGRIALFANEVELLAFFLRSP